MFSGRIAAKCEGVKEKSVSDKSATRDTTRNKNEHGNIN